MEERIIELYHVPNLSEYQDIHLLELREHCAAPEEKVFAVLERLPEQDRQAFEAYLISVMN